MPQIPPAGMSQVIPYLFYKDLPQAMDWLQKAFGFERVLIHPTGNERHHGEMRSFVGSGSAQAQPASTALPRVVQRYSNVKRGD